MTGYATVAQAVQALRAGRPVLVLDDQNRENEGDVVLAAALASEQWVAWTVRHTSGFLCAPMPETLADRLHLPPMVEHNQDARGTAYTVSVDARWGVGTGISAADRARTARVLAEPLAGPEDLVRPGHVLPLRARSGGVRERAGHTEAAVELCTLAGLPPVALIAELVHDDGQMMRRDAVLALGEQDQLPVLTIADLAAYLDACDAAVPATTPAAGPATTPATGPASASAATHQRSSRVLRGSSTVLPTRHGELAVTGYRDAVTGADHLVLTSAWPPGSAPVVRVHSECLTGDAFGSLRCDCGPQLQAAMDRVCQGGGVVVYLRGHEGRGIGLLAKLRAYALQDDGLDTVEANLFQDLPADAREYGAAAAILADLGIGEVRLLSNSPAKVAELIRHGIAVREQLPLVVAPGPHNQRYLTTKRDRFGHHLSLSAGGRS